MYRYLDFSGTGEFKLFSISHLSALVFIILFIVGMIIFFKKNNDERLKKTFRTILAIMLLLQELLFKIWNLAFGKMSLSYSLPLYLCSLALFVCAFMLITKNKTSFEIAYFWGLGASVQSLITPALYDFDFPHFRFFEFFIAHGAVVASIFFMIFIEKYRPTIVSVIKVMVITLVSAILIYFINIFLNTNYLFLIEKPDTTSLLSFIGSGIMYRIELFFLAFVFFIFLYMPYFIYDLINKNKILPGKGETNE